MENGSSNRRDKSVPAMMVWNQGKPVETLMSSSIHEVKPEGYQLASPSAARSPYWRGVNAASVSRASGWDRGEADTTASAGIASAVGVVWETGTLDATSGGGAKTGSEIGVSRGTVSVGTASDFFEKSHMLRVVRGPCTRGGHGKRPMR